MSVEPSNNSSDNVYIGNVKDSGNRKEFVGGAQRDIQISNGRFDLLPVHTIFKIAKHFQNGALKYSDRNWERGLPLNSFLDSALRHTFKFLGGAQDEPHLEAAIWNLMCLLETKERINQGLLPKELDNLPSSVYNDPKNPKF